MADTVVVIQCPKGGPRTLEVMSTEEHIIRLRRGDYNHILRFLVGATKPVDLASFDGLIVIEGELSQVKPHEALAQ